MTTTKRNLFTGGLIAALLPLAMWCKVPTPAANQALVVLASGEVRLESAGKTVPLSAGQLVANGQTVVTGKNGVAILRLGDGRGKAEVQAETRFTLGSLGAAQEEVNLEKGNVWLQVNKKAERQISLKTPTSVAAVRGTKFYTFITPEFTATCHCQGDVEFSVPGGAYRHAHHSDQFVVVKKGITVMFEPGELDSIFGRGHEHSSLKDSPLGKPVTHSETQLKAFHELLDKKYTALKAKAEADAKKK